MRLAAHKEQRNAHPVSVYMLSHHMCTNVPRRRYDCLRGQLHISTAKSSTLPRHSCLPCSAPQTKSMRKKRARTHAQLCLSITSLMPKLLLHGQQPVPVWSRGICAHVRHFGHGGSGGLGGSRGGRGFRLGRFGSREVFGLGECAHVHPRIVIIARHRIPCVSSRHKHVCMMGMSVRQNRRLLWCMVGMSMWECSGMCVTTPRINA